MKLKMQALVGIMGLTSICQAHAAVTAAEAQQLGTTLTQFGAIKAGSADGAIPAYTGGITAMSGLPAGGGPNTGWPDPFASDQSVATITATNMAQYAAELTPGVQALLQRFPDFSITVYPTHRTFSYPAYVLANTVKNATTAQEVGDGLGVSGAYGGIPFPIPQDGAQAMWNGTLHYIAPYCHIAQYADLVDASGNVTDLVSPLDDFWVTPYYDPVASSLPSTTWQFYRALGHQPAANNGKQYLLLYPIDYTKNDQITWYYTPGTRRVRLAPEDKYDTPITDYGGAFDFDEIDMFAGELDRFSWKLVGEKEMIIPYNDYAFDNTPIDNLIGPHVVKPSAVRWERHRVWVVDGMLAPGARHIYSRWTFYIDEDSWNYSLSESYDHGGSIYRVGMAFPSQNYGEGDATNFIPTYTIYDLSKNTYALSYTTPQRGAYHCEMSMPDMAKYTPQAMAASGIR